MKKYDEKKTLQTMAINNMAECNKLSLKKELNTNESMIDNIATLAHFQ